MFGLMQIAAAADSEGPSWLMEDEVNGLLFPIDDVEACATATQRLLRDDELSQRCVANGSEKLQGEFSQQVIIDNFMRLFEQSMTEKS